MERSASLPRRKVVVSQLFLLLVLTLSASIFARLSAQVSGGFLSGTVTDPSGGAVSGARILVDNLATGVTRDLRTDVAGFYAVPNLLPGTYEVTVSTPGFATVVRTGITLTVGVQQVLNLTLKVGSMAEKIEVVGEAPAVQLASSSISAEVDSTTIRELPLNARSWTDLATLEPGVAAIRTQPAGLVGSPIRGTRGFGAEVTISGVRPQWNNYRLDGVSINDYSNGAPGSVLGGNLGVDAIQEFSVLTSNYSAEYGRTAGGVVNAITRSGTNQFHGSAYEFLRNSVLDARNFLDASKIPPFRRNQFGADAGGPIRKDRTFIFGDYEAIRQSQGVTYLDTVPSANVRKGILAAGGIPPNPCPQNSSLLDPAANICVDNSAAKYLHFYPLPNGTLVGAGDLATFSFPAQQVVNENFVTTRLDHKISAKDGLFGTYLYDRATFQSPDPLDVQLAGSRTRRHVVVVEENHVFSPTLLNTARVGYSRESANADIGLSAINPLAANTSLGAVPGRAAANVQISGVTPFAGGLGGFGSYNFYWNSFQGYDDIFLTRGKHSLRVGASVERIDLNFNKTVNPTGVFRFGSLRSFLTNAPTLFQGPSSANQGFRQTIFGAYVQDDWQLRRNLTLNLGLRYEMATVLKDVRGELSNLLNITDSTAHLGDPYFLNPTLRDFEPRVGFAWDPSGNGKTAVRSGFGLYDILPLPYQFIVYNSLSQPFSLDATVHSPKLPPGGFFAGAAPLLSVTTLTQAYVQHAPKRSYVMQWNLNVQRELFPNLTAEIGYVGSHGVHEPFTIDDMNIVIPTLTSAGYLLPRPIASGTTLNPAFGDIGGILYEGKSSYNALEAGIQKRMSGGLQLRGSFTWEKSIDTDSSSMAGNQFTNSISSWWPYFDHNASRGLSDFNVGRTFVFNAIWDVPNPKSVTGPVGWVTKGWQLGGIFTVQDGMPFTATFGTDGDPQGLNSTDPWAFPDRLTGPGCETLTNPGNPSHYIKTQCFALPTAPNMAFWQANCDTNSPIYGPNLTPEPYPVCFNLRGNAGRNILIGPGLTDLDFSIFKNNPIPRISEAFNVQFRAEFFNLLNHANFAMPDTPTNTDIFDSTSSPNSAAGLLTSTTTAAREIQFGLKIIW
jgi:hypothetical protein